MDYTFKNFLFRRYSSKVLFDSWFTAKNIHDISNNPTAVIIPFKLFINNRKIKKVDTPLSDPFSITFYNQSQRRFVQYLTKDPLWLSLLYLRNIQMDTTHITIFLSPNSLSPIHRFSNNSLIKEITKKSWGLWAISKLWLSSNQQYPSGI